jgi:hypothetical protein
MGDVGSCFRNTDHEYMRRSRPEIVLDEQYAIGPRCRRREARMLESQWGRSVDALHERRDEAPIGLDDPISLGAFDFLGRYFPLEPVQLLMHVHDENVEAVARRRPTGRHRGDRLTAYHVVD